MVSELIDKYLWLVQTFVDAGSAGLSYAQLERRWCSRYGTETYPRRSFNNHRDGIAEVFGIEITCDRSTNRYFIDAGESAVDKRQSVQWLVNTFTVNNLLTLGKERLSGRVSVEDIPSGHRWLTAVMQAMLQDRVLEIHYRKYLSEGTDFRHVHPYAVKEFAKRWYVVGYNEEAGAVRVYAMDRILELKESGTRFTVPKDFDVDRLFADSYGIYPPEGEKPVLVRLKATRREAAYLKDLPLHPSQIVEREEGEDVYLALRLIPNPNFIMELCRHGAALEVLSPQSLREEVAAALEQALTRYRGK